ncbi:2-iminobutanoate/2-iminopropanoate deaminase-like [Ruditapes philippinarum]|uniref:2-iminobutanoate/2-iminopropanoate deaminase-like n=1 Tax=Ruditapes philippinarum TaxID=129788 RepID=UPI00295C3207|nr:2-iminobutanoate/2-iminopropanoate deaminase-like [Ruditapes philippinarum]
MSKMAGIVRKIVQTAKAPGAVGPYSQAVIADNTMYISGQIGLDVNTKALVEGGAVPEAEQALKNMGEILQAAGVTYKNVVKCTVLLADIKDFHAVNDVYVKYFPENKPARAAYQAAALPLGAKVEIEAIAVIGNIVDV